MTTTEQLLSEFIDLWNAGRRPDVEAFLQQAPADERDALADALMDWLAVAPVPDYDDAARAAIRAEPAVQAALAAVEAPAGAWPRLLPRLRERAGLGVRELAARVVATLGLGGGEDRAAGYLEQMEDGRLDPRRVSRRLLDALGDALGVDAGRLAEAGSLGLALRPGAPAPAGALLFRDDDAAGRAVAADIDALSRAALSPAPAPLDELDRLFLGGPDA